jgi:hypothetical protein
MRNLEEKLRRAKELNSTDFGEYTLRDNPGGFDPNELRFSIGNIDPDKIFRKTKRKIFLLSIGILYLVVAIILGTISIFGYLKDLILFLL